MLVGILKKVSYILNIEKFILNRLSYRKNNKKRIKYIVKIEE